MKHMQSRRVIAWITINAMIAMQTVPTARAAQTVLATSPLANETTAVVRPNIMYVLDNSGSMAWDYTPDYVNDTSSKLDPTGAPTTASHGLCWGVSGSGGTGGQPLDTDKAVQCTQSTQIPYSTSAINYQFYDPGITYVAPLKPNGSPYAQSNPSAAPCDGFSATGACAAVFGQNNYPASNNLTTQWPHQVWCSSATAKPTAADPTGGGKCIENSDTTDNNLVPDALHSYLITYFGAPFYFTMGNAEYCTTSRRDSCVRSTTSTVIGDVTFNVPSDFRWCNSYSTVSHTFSGCQDRRDASHLIPNYLGGWVAAGTTGTYPSASLKIKSVVDGQSISKITIGGTTVTGGTIASPANGTTANAIAKAICSAVSSTAGSTGFDCRTTPTGDTVTLQAGTVGEDANGLQVLVFGPPPLNPKNSEGAITILDPPPVDYQINSVVINGNDLLAVPGSPVPPAATQIAVTSSGDSNDTARKLCEALNLGAFKDTYRARSGSPDWGTCKLPTETGLVEIQRVPFDATDNGQTIVVSGPPTTPVFSGTITIISTPNSTRIDDIQVGGVSILNNKPLIFADGTQTATIAAKIVSEVNTGTGCSATYTGSVVNLTGSATCKGTVAVLGTAVAASGSFRVSTTGSALAANMSGINVSDSATPAVKHTIASAVSFASGTAVLTNATALRAAVGSGFSAAAPVAVGGSYDITVTAPASAGSTYNGKSFEFLNGLATGGSGGTKPQWTFNITNATTLDKKIASIRCNGNDIVSPNTASTLGASMSNMINDLAINAATNGLSGRGANGYTISCTPATPDTPKSVCTVIAPAGTDDPACASGLTIAKAASISINNLGRISAPIDSGGTAARWTFDVTNATAPSAFASSITCGGTNTINTNVANTGSAVADATLTYINALAKNGSGNLESADTNGYDYTCTSATAGTPKSTCTVLGPSGAAACTNLNFTNDGSITIANASSASTACTTARWTFAIKASADDRSVNSIKCGSVNTQSSASSSNNHSSVTNWTNDITGKDGSNGLTTRGTNSYVYTCTNATDANGATCTVEGPDACTNLTFDVDSNVTISNPTAHVCVGATRPQWTFDITNATAGNKFVNAITCGATNTIATGTANTGVAQDPPSVTYINRLTKANSGNDLETADTNSYNYACTTATAAAPKSTCTVTAPGVTPACANLSFNVDPSITIANASTAIGGKQGAAYRFEITGATTIGTKITDVTCGTFGGTAVVTAADATVGAASATSVDGRINNLTKASGTGLESIELLGYDISCSTATASVPSSKCTVNGPVGVAACASLAISPDPSITISASTLTDGGSAATGAVGDFVALNGITQVAPFSGGYSVQSASVSELKDVSIGTIPTTVKAMSDGNAADPKTIPTNASGSGLDILTLAGGTPPAAANSWIGVGIFKRTDVVAANNAYNRAAGRTDCVGATCTYAEELQNFANWFSYYRTRMQMMKTTSTLAFNALDDKFRVGFDDICNCDSTSCATTVKRGVAQFTDDLLAETPGQRTAWWNQLTGSTPNCATPLRAATAKMGRYYAGKLSSADPIQYSCQQNFMLLVTDGYWNEGERTSIARPDNSDIGNVDNTAARPFSDGAQASTACPTQNGSTRSTASSCRTLADIAWYYYSTDLRGAAFGNSSNTLLARDVSQNNVPITADDNNTAQHMTFFAMGLGVDGTLQYRSDYATAGVGDYADITLGTRNWPAVKNLDPTGIDDLWHAAVNGRGKYFSARNPTSVVAGLKEALNKMGQRIGAASAAATSNLEPVAGDNFAYVASYATVDWVGDLQARSINLATGAVSSDTNCGASGSGCLWSAQPLLDNKPYATRNIFLAPTLGATGDPLRPFEFGQLTDAEKTSLDPSADPKLSQYEALKLSPEFSTENLVNFLRGDRTREMNGEAQPQIWRKRTHVLGDIVNTQPVFVGSSRVDLQACKLEYSIVSPK